MQCKEFGVHSTSSKCVYLPLNHELEVSNPFNIQTECSALKERRFFKDRQHRRQKSFCPFFGSVYLIGGLDRDIGRYIGRWIDR